MGQLTVLGSNRRPPGADAPSPAPRLLRFRPTLLSEIGPTKRRVATPVVASLVGHGMAIVALVLAPLLFYEAQLPIPTGVVRARR